MHHKNQREAVLFTILFTILFTAGLALADGLKALIELTKTNSDTAVPVRLVAARGQYYRSATVYGKRAARTDNTTSVFIGTSSTNNTQTIEVTAGGFVTITAPPNAFYDLYDLYLDVGTAGDGVVVVFDPAP